MDSAMNKTGGHGVVTDDSNHLPAVGLPKFHWLLAAGLAAGGLLLGLPTSAVRAGEPVAAGPVRSGPAGSLVIVGGGDLPTAIIDRFLELGGGPAARLVVITTASSTAEWPLEQQPHQRLWASRPLASLTVLHTRNPDIANSETFCRPLRSATAVWFVGGDQNQITRTYLGTRTETALHDVIRRGGVIGGTSAGAAIMSRVMIVGGRTEPQLGDGLGFLPGTIVDQHFLKRNRLPRLMAALEQRPGHVGIGIDESTAIVVRRRGIECIGDSEVRICLASSHNRPERVQPLRSGEQFDLETWRLAATARARFGSYAQAAERPAPNVRQGSVVITGGRTPQAAVHEFLKLAGGKDARVVLVAHRNEETTRARQQLTDCLREAGAENVRFCEADNADDWDETSLNHWLGEASGVWLLGERDQPLLELLAASPLRQLVLNVLDRGGAIGGSSAAARIHGDGVICRRQAGDEPQTLLAEAYECGLGLLTGLVIDDDEDNEETHEPAVSVLATALRDRFPNCVGVGLRSEAAVVVRGHTLRVVGSNSVAVVGQHPASDEERSPYELVQAGQSYDLRARRLMQTEADTDDTATR
jgi:cyanophycinase